MVGKKQRRIIGYRSNDYYRSGQEVSRAPRRRDEKQRNIPCKKERTLTFAAITSAVASTNGLTASGILRPLVLFGILTSSFAASFISFFFSCALPSPVRNRKRRPARKTTILNLKPQKGTVLAKVCVCMCGCVYVCTRAHIRVCMYTATLANSSLRNYTRVFKYTSVREKRDNCEINLEN